MKGRRNPRLRPLLVAVLTGLLAALALPWTAMGAIEDRVPSMLSPRGVTDSDKPTFVWSASTDNDDPLLGYRLVIDNGPPISLPATTTTYTPEAALAPGNHSWYVTAVETDDEYTQLDPGLFPQQFIIDDVFPAPTLTGPSGLINDDSPTFSWTGTLAEPLFHWQLVRTGQNEQIIDSVLEGTGTPNLSQAFTDLEDGAYAFIVRQRQFPFAFGSQALKVFTVDTTAPAQLQVTTRPAQIGTETNVAFGWGGGEPGATFVWQLLGSGGAVAQGPGTTTTPSVSLQVTPGSYVFQVAQVDAAGNVGQLSGPEPFTVQQVTTPTTPTTPTPTTPTTPEPEAPPDAGDEDDPPATRNAGALTPRAGARFSALRPTLRWPTRRGATLYNVQIFQVNGERLTKVVSAFPRNNIFRVPPRQLRAGFRYIWRIWPFVDGAYPGQPLGVSYFDVKPGATAGGGGGGNARLRRQMLISQRIAQSAVRRLNAVQEWLDQGLVTGDLIGGGLGAVDLAPSIITAPLSPPHAVEDAAPRPVVVAPAGARTDATGLRVSSGQLRINQRIAAAAVRRANALEARLDRGLTGGDLRGAVVTLGKLQPGLQITQTLPGVAPPASQTILAPLGQSSGRVRVSRNQLRINQRISQAAVRRANALVERLERGLSGADFQDGSIATANLVDALR